MIKNERLNISGISAAKLKDLIDLKLKYDGKLASEVESLKKELTQKNDFSLDEILELLELPLEVLITVADHIRKEFVGEEVHLRGIIEFSNYCRKNCFYCGLRRNNKKLLRYRMSPEEIIEVAKIVVSSGCKTVVLQSGEDLYYDRATISYIIREIKSSSPVAVTLSLGERSREDYAEWKKARADRYLLKQETYNRELFRKLHPDDLYEERILHRKWLKELGYQVGTGNIVGLPGQQLLHIAEDILGFLKEDSDMIGIGPFIPHPDTPLWGFEPENLLELTLKTVAVTRIVTKDTLIPATTAMGTIDPEGREKALLAGANVVMPNFTPVKYKPLYEIYPNKICIFEGFGKCVGCLEGKIRKLGRTPSAGRGDRLKRAKRPLS